MTNQPEGPATHPLTPVGTKPNKAIAVGLVSGGGGMLISNPVAPAVSFGLQALGLPQEAAEPLAHFLGAIIYGLGMSWLTYKVAN